MSNTNNTMETQTSNALHNAIMEAGGKDRPPMLASGNYNPPYKFKWTVKTVPVAEGIDNDIYSIVDAFPNACEMWKAIKRLKQGESINVQDLETNLYWEFRKFTSRDGESLESYYSRFYKMMNELVRNQCDVTNHQVNVQFLLQLQPKWKSKDNQDNSPRINRGTGYDNQMVVNVAGARENVGTQKPKRAKDAAYHKENTLLCKQKEAGVQFKKFVPNATDISGPIFDVELLQKVKNDDDNYNVFDNDREHPEQPESVNEPYPDDTDELAQERDLLASLIEKLKCKIDDSKNRNKFLESSNKALVDKLKGEIKGFKTKNKSLESSNNHFKEANNELSKTNQLMFKDLKKFQAELDRYHDVNYASKVAIDCAKAKGDLMSYKIESEKSFNEYTQKINDLNQTISDMKKELFAHQQTISIMSQEKEAQTRFHKTHDDKELEKIIALENKIKALDDIVYNTGQSVQTMNMLNRNCKKSFVKPEFLKKAQRANPRLINADLEKFNLCLKEEMVADLRYFNSLKHEVDSLKSQLETQKTQFLNEIDRLSREYYYADHMNAILGVYTTLGEFTDLQCDYLDQVVKCEHLEKELSKSNTMSKSFEALQQHVIDLELALQQC
ncbi:hypothetical protein Tco_1393573 [Tanacetum coccineum]